MVKNREVTKLRPTFVFYFNILLQLVLFVIFLVFFGIPSVQKYLDQETIVIYSEDQTDGIEPPAITFLAMKNHRGWKSVQGDNISNVFNMVDHCKRIGYTDFEACAKNDSFGLVDFLYEAKIGAFKPKSLLMNSSLWREDLTITPYGRHFTLKIPGIIRRNHSDFLLFHVDTNSAFYYSIWVHDEKFFLININPFRNNVCENT